MEAMGLTKKIMFDDDPAQERHYDTDRSPAKADSPVLGIGFVPGDFSLFAGWNPRFAGRTSRILRCGPLHWIVNVCMACARSGTSWRSHLLISKKIAMFSGTYLVGAAGLEPATR
jgi:hypothetical protein